MVIIRQIIMVVLLLLLATSSFARDWWQFPDANSLPDTARILVYDSSLPANDPDRRSRNVTMLTLKQLLNPMIQWDGIQNKPSTFTPAAHSHAASSINNLAAVATSNDYEDLSNKPTIPGPQVNSDWNAESGPSQIRNKPIIPSQSSQITHNGSPVSSLIEQLLLFMGSGNLVLSDTVTGIKYGLSVVMDTDSGRPTLAFTEIASSSVNQGMLDMDFTLGQSYLR